MPKEFVMIDKEKDDYLPVIWKKLGEVLLVNKKVIISTFPLIEGEDYRIDGSKAIEILKSFPTREKINGTPIFYKYTIRYLKP